MLTEARALAQWQSAEPFGSPATTSDAVVFLALATSPPAANQLTNIHFATPVFANRLSWVFLWAEPIEYCPSTSIQGHTPTPPPPPKLHYAVELIAADGSGEGLAISRNLTLCTGVSETSVVPASYHLSIPWKLIQRKGNSGVVHTTTPSLCGYWTGSGGSLGSRFAVDFIMFMVRGPCTVRYPKQVRDVTFKVEIFGPEIHAPTGLVLGRATSRFTLLYYDGQPHSVALGCYANPGRGGNPPLKC